jgi:hypothetical protein
MSNRAETPSDTVLVAELQRRLDQLSAVFSLVNLEGAGQNAEDITSYYEQSRLGYKAVHSAGGAMHMSLNSDGVFSKDGYTAQARLVSRHINPDNNVLELAMGNGFNLHWLASRYSDTHFWVLI